MSQELIYTSAPKGLKLGSRGFCTVASTSGMAKNLADRMEALSGYKHLFAPGDRQARLNPVNISYMRFKLGGRTYCLLSRIADAGLDYTQRTNKLAHHIALDQAELVTAGPAWLASQPDFFTTAWTGEPRIVAADRRIPQGQLQTRVCRTWANAAGDAGWAGVLAESLVTRGLPEAYVICKADTDRLALILEAQSLLPPERRWDATFSTYFTKVPPSVDCRWRCVIDGTPEAARARQAPEKLVIDLVRPLDVATGGQLVLAARTGKQTGQSDESLATKETMAAASRFSGQSTAPALPGRSAQSLRAQVLGATPERPPALPSVRGAASRTPRPRRRRFFWKAAAYACSLAIAMILGGFGFWGFDKFRRPVVVSESHPVTQSGADHQAREQRSPPEDEKPIEKNGLPLPQGTLPPSRGGSGSKKTTSPKAHEPEPPAPKEPKKTNDLETKDLLADFDKPVYKKLNPVNSVNWNGPVSLAGFSTAKPSLKLALLGVAINKDDKPLVSVRIINDSKYNWEIRAHSQAVADIEIARGNTNPGELYFRWKKDIKNTQNNIEDTIVSAILELRTSTSPRRYRYVYFRRGTKRDSPIRIGKTFSPRGSGSYTKYLDDDVRVPDGQQSRLRFHLTGLPNLEKAEKAKLTGSLVEGDSTIIRFGPKETIRLSIKFGLNLNDKEQDKERVPQIIASILPAEAYDDSSTLFPQWLKSRRGERNELSTDLQEPFKKYVLEALGGDVQAMPLWLLRQLGNEGVVSGNAARGVFTVNKNLFQRWIKRNRAALPQIVEQLPNSVVLQNSGLLPAVKNLRQHEKDYPYFMKWEEILKGLSRTLKLHVRLTRVPVLPKGDDRRPMPEIDYYIAGDPDHRE